MVVLNAIATLVAFITFIGIVWWAWSRGRAKANRDASMLPFAQPDEGDLVDPDLSTGQEQAGQNGTRQQSDAQGRVQRKQEGSHE